MEKETVVPYCGLMYNGKLLGYRFKETVEKGEYYFDISASKIPEELIQTLHDLPMTDLIVGDDGAFTTELEKELTIVVSDVSECKYHREHIMYHHNLPAVPEFTWRHVIIRRTDNNMRYSYWMNTYTESGAIAWAMRSMCKHYNLPYETTYDWVVEEVKEKESVSTN